MFNNFASLFSCRDKNVEDFLKRKAVEFDRRNVARTYLILDGEAYERDELIILAYFTLANKPLLLGDTLSNRTKKDIDGFSKDAAWKQ